MKKRWRLTRARRARRGMTLLEAGVAVLVMSAAIVGVLELVSAASKERRARWQRQAALMEVANQAERIALLDWEDASPERLTSWEPSPMLLRAVMKPNCQVRVVDEAEQPRARRVELAVSWTNSAGEAVRQAKVTQWKFASGDER